MRTGYALLLGAGLLGVGILGCVDKPKRPTITPPREEFHVPEDSLFRSPPKYPDELLNNVMPRRSKDDDNKMPPPGAMNNQSMGGPGVGRAGP